MTGGSQGYWHRQHAPMYLFVYATALAFFLAGWTVRTHPPLAYVFPIVGVLMLAIGASFHYMTVADEGDRLSIRFGPFPLFGTSIRYDDIKNAEVGKTTFLEGWGIHLSYRGGWVWNLWGWDCVVVTLRNGTIRIGSDDAKNLAEFINRRIRRRA